jgi:hypothetical protein
MAYKILTTNTVQIIALRYLFADALTLCELHGAGELPGIGTRAGRCWTNHVQALDPAQEQGMRLTEADLNALTKCSIYMLTDFAGLVMR